MKKCNLCGQEIQGWGNNPWPLCDREDEKSQCCNDCNSNLIIPARLIQMQSEKKNPEVGDKIMIFWMHDEPRVKDYMLRTGEITEIDDIGQLWGSWGTLAIDPKVDNFCVLND